MIVARGGRTTNHRLTGFLPPSSSLLETEASDDLAGPRPANDGGRLFKAEAGSDCGPGGAGAGGAGGARCEAGRRRQRSRRTWGGKYGAVKDVHELRPKAEAHRLADLERAPHIKVL